MEHNSSFNKQLGKEITARAVMNKKMKKLEVDKDVNNKKIGKISQEINRIKKALRRRKQKDQKYRALSSRLNELNISKTNLRNKIDVIKQIISLIE